jgi:hypothetical protein
MIVREVYLYRDRPPAYEDAISIVWPDEREGVATVATLAAVEALLQYYYDLPFPTKASGKISETVIAANLAADIEPVDSGYRVTVRRLPRGKTQEAAWRLATETQMYQIIEQEGALGVRFWDEGVSVPFAR